MVKKFAIVIISLGILVPNGIAQNAYTLRNNQIELSIDKKGNLQVLKNLQTGQNYATGKPLWRLYYDVQQEKDIEILAQENSATIKQENDQISINYTNLMSRGEKIEFALSLKISLEDDKVRFSSKVTNNQTHTIIRELQYPLVGDCRIPADHKLLTTLRGGHIYSNPMKKVLSLPHTYMGPDHHFRSMDIKYPIGVASNCFALIGDGQGLYFGSHDSTFQTTVHGFRVYPDQEGDFNKLEIGLYKYPNCLSGQSWSNDANVIAPYNGDWHQTSKIYRTWVDTWWEHSEEPEWVKNMIGFQRIILKHQYGETLFTYEEFPARVKNAGESVGINVAFPFGWWNSGMDNGYPDSYYETDSLQGGDQAWKQAIANFQKDGGKVIMYFNGKLIDTESNYYKNSYGKDVCLKSNTGTQHTEAYRFSGPGTFTGYFNARSFVVADTREPMWQKELKRMADRALELGANSVFYDQLGYAESKTNWNLNTEFPIPNLCVIIDKANALKMIHDYIDVKDKNLAIGTEHITDYTSQYVDYVHGIFHVGSWTGKNQTNFIEWFRYTFPEVILTDRNVDGDEENIEWLTNRATLLGLRTNVQTFRLRGLIDETPDYQEYLVKINQLKKEYSSLLLLGKYCDTEGFSINNKEIEARSYANEDQMAIVLTHNKQEKESAKLFVPGYKYIESSGVGDIQVSIDETGIPNVKIGKSGLVIIIYEHIKE